MIEAACNGDRLVNGPAAYYMCLDEQLTALRQVTARPVLGNLSPADRTMIDAACNGDRLVNGPSAYYHCLEGQIAALVSVTARPDLRGVSNSDRAMMESACNGDRLVNGPAAYYTCMSGHVQDICKPAFRQRQPRQPPKRNPLQPPTPLLRRRGKAIRSPPKQRFATFPARRTARRAIKTVVRRRRIPRKQPVRLSATPGETDGRPVALAAGAKANQAVQDPSGLARSTNAGTAGVPLPRNLAPSGGVPTTTPTKPPFSDDGSDSWRGVWFGLG